MLEVMQFIFSDVWHFLGVAALLALAVMWKPVEINLLNDNREEKSDGSKAT